MFTRIIVSTVASLFVGSIAFSQVKSSRANQSPTPTPTPPARQKMVPASAQIQAKQSPTPTPKTTPVQAQSIAPPRRTTTTPIQPRPTSTPAPTQSRPMATPAPTQAKPTPTPVPPPDVKAYLDRQVANSKDNKFHFPVNGKDLALTPFHVWRQKSTGPNSTSTCIDMRSDDGRIYDIDFMTTGAQVTGIRIHKINGEALR
jgi:hypothetical protein